MPVVAVAFVVPLYVVWAAVLSTGGGDLAAQTAWAGFMDRHPGSAVNLSWYGGAHIANYSLLAPPLMSLFGVRAVSVAAGLVGSWAMAALFVRSGVRWPLAPALLGSFTLWCNVASGRTTFALGVAVGLFAVVYVRRPVVVVVAGVLATCASPVAGLFLVVVGAAYGLDRQWRTAATLIVPPVLVVAATTVLFPFHGEMPMSPSKLWMPLATSAVLVAAAPREWRLVRYGSGIYAIGVVLTFLIPTPIGTNVERLVGLVGPQVLLAAVLVRGLAKWQYGLLAALLAVNTGWVVDKTNDDLEVSNPRPAWAAHTEGVTRELARLGSDRTRIEVVPARDHREAAVIAPHANLARGWNRQLDVERGRLFYDGSIDEETYRAWLDRWAVGFVVLHAGKPDGPAEREAELVRSEPSWLEPVWQDADWRIYRVKDARPLVEAPGRAVGGNDAELVVRMEEAGSARVRIAYSPWLTADGGACVTEDRAEDGDWVRLEAPRAGEYRIGSRYADRFGGGGGGGGGSCG
ncbi:hypothetical protein [Streptomyces sp. NPDC050504]|uniref:hypothetical protein n=1 Tax=Streptomyces sp. NPDC050504 TaxID=3365618 RepID=UPI00378BCFC1